jgi:RimJ/RimL family protein N-acetyltransferase
MKRPTIGAASSPNVQLGDLDDDALKQLVLAAVPATDVEEVMPLTAGPASWTPQRLREFVAFHHGRRGGLDGPVGEVSWVILVDEMASGIVRLQRVESDSLEVGMWLTRSARGHGIGGRALALAAHMATELGASRLVAETTASNRAALAALIRIGADIHAPSPDGGVHAEVDLTIFAKNRR